jgi:hypothetical protein
MVGKLLKWREPEKQTVVLVATTRGIPP